ncbi:MAG TPA: peptidoglycan bridge formation glycyltransferase FemA/FemB family protein [Candidatus Paceibacterota bacterium]|nr:peptidoglycan bridge formation glycyltransferase FemA/FemB family protein [Candidatus Paceibacterota bacterium]
MHSTLLSDTLHVAPVADIRAEPINIHWDESLPVFAKEEFLKAVGDEYGWLGGHDTSQHLRCILPYTIIRKAGLRLVRFRVQTIPMGDGLNLHEEKSFLNSVVRYFRNAGADVIVPASNNAIFRTYPDGADAAPYGSYIIDLRMAEELLWKQINRTVRLNIGTAQRAGITVADESRNIDSAYDLIKETFARSKIAFMDRDSFRKYVHGLGSNGSILVAKYLDAPHSFCLFGYSKHCAYAIYAGNILQQHQGANKLLYWEAIRRFREQNVSMFDFVGARINPEKGSKQESINLMKKRFGATLIDGYMWKYPLRPLRSRVYTIGVRLLRGGDLVDQERHKLKQDRTPVAD